MSRKLILPNDDFSVMNLSTPEQDRYVVLHKLTGKRAYGSTENECFNDLLTELEGHYNRKVIRGRK